MHLSELPAIQGPGSLTWHPVRLALGIDAFGTNAYTADEIGQDVVEPHTEASDDPAGAHQELYYVATGRATFTIDGEQHDAPAGTFVFLPDPNSHRHAVAAEAPTTVLSFGGPATFEPSPWEWTFQARALIDTDPQRAREVLEDGLARHPENEALRHELARLNQRG
jgi:hypothetical protein